MNQKIFTFNLTDYINYGFKNICVLIEENINIETLCFNNIFFHEGDIKNLSEVIKKSKIIKLSITNTNLDSISIDEIKYLAEALKENIFLQGKSLDLSYNRLNDTGIKYIAQAFSDTNANLDSFISILQVTILARII